MIKNAGNVVLYDDQQEIFDDLMDRIKKCRKRFSAVIKGYAGTGKSTLVSEIIKQLNQSYVLAITTPTHKANEVLRNMLSDTGIDVEEEDITACTIHSFLGLKIVYKEEREVLVHDARTRNANCYVDVLIVDEGSMISHEIFNELMAQIHRVRLCVLFVGDSAQLPPVLNAEEMEKQLTTGVPLDISPCFDVEVQYEMTEVRRQALENPVLKLATEVRQAIGNTRIDPTNIFRKLSPTDAEQVIQIDDVVTLYETFAGMVDNTNSDTIFDSISRYRVLSYTNNGVQLANEYIRAHVYPDVVEEFITGEPIMFDFATQNSGYHIQSTIKCPPAKKVKYFGIECWRMDDGQNVFYAVGPQSRLQLKEYMKDLVRKINSREINPLTKDPYNWGEYYLMKETFCIISYPYATTIHKSQGSTFDMVWLDLTPLRYLKNVMEHKMLCQILYTGMTRPKYKIIFTL